MYDEEYDSVVCDDGDCRRRCLKMRQRKCEQRLQLRRRWRRSTKWSRRMLPHEWMSTKIKAIPLAELNCKRTFSAALQMSTIVSRCLRFVSYYATVRMLMHTYISIYIYIYSCTCM